MGTDRPVPRPAGKPVSGAIWLPDGVRVGRAVSDVEK